MTQLKEYKQVILIRQDLKLSKGKMASQASHASVECVLKSDKLNLEKWRIQGMKKVILKVESLKELANYKEKAEDLGLITAVVRDAGKTQVIPGTTTCLGIGPDDSTKIDKVTGNLKLQS